MLDLVPTSREELVGIVVIQDGLVCSDHKTVVRSSWHQGGMQQAPCSGLRRAHSGFFMVGYLGQSPGRQRGTRMLPGI